MVSVSSATVIEPIISSLVSRNNVPHDRNLMTMEMKRKQEDEQSAIIDKELIKIIQNLPVSKEKRVIAFSLYGTGKTRYTVGAIENAKLVKTYFPGWVCRYYITGTVDDVVLDELKSLGAEIIKSHSNMFARFLIAEDETVDRYIVRDVDSRMSARDRYYRQLSALLCIDVYFLDWQLKNGYRAKQNFTLFATT